VYRQLEKIGFQISQDMEISEQNFVSYLLYKKCESFSAHFISGKDSSISILSKSPSKEVIIVNGLTFELEMEESQNRDSLYTQTT
jgi:hypothetical protein